MFGTKFSTKQVCGSPWQFVWAWMPARLGKSTNSRAQTKKWIEASATSNLKWSWKGKCLAPIGSQQFTQQQMILATNVWRQDTCDNGLSLEQSWQIVVFQVYYCCKLCYQKRVFSSRCLPQPSCAQHTNLNSVAYSRDSPKLDQPQLRDFDFSPGEGAKLPQAAWSSTCTQRLESFCPVSTPAA